VNWYPEHLKHGRFRNIVESAPDWTISRNRFWASPLPIWKHEETGEVHVFGSLKELRERTKKSGNKYLFVRHGQADSNAGHYISSSPNDENHVTEEGKAQVKATAEQLKDRGVTKIVVSPLMRTRETADIIAETIGYDTAAIEVVDGIKEWQLGEFDGKPVSDMRSFYSEYASRFTKAPKGGETLVDMKRRIAEALYGLEEKYENETVLIVGHEYTCWFLDCAAQGADVEKCIEIRGMADDYVKNAEVREIDFVPLPHNAAYELDLHRPYIDELPLIAADGGALTRIPEVVDCWVESGAMPFAAEHYPHENEEAVERRYPGDFISEYIAQTRTWFYYMHALGVLLFNAPSFKNCVTTGNIQAADGAKMSKSKGNYTDPLEDMDKYGADAARFYMLGSVVMAGEDVAFKDEELREAHNRFVNMLWNSYKFYEMHAAQLANRSDERPTSTNVLDQWILAKLTTTVHQVTEHLDGYNTVKAATYMRDFVTDLSTWYIRRSRDRFKADNI